MKRSQFLKVAGAAAAGLYFSGDLFAAGNTQNLALQLYSVRDAVAKDLEGTLERLVKLGYNKLEIYGDNGKFFGHTAAEFKAILKRTGVEVVSSHHISGISMKSPGTLSEGWSQTVEDLKTVGAKYAACSFLFPAERTPDIYKTLPDLLNKSGETARAAGLRFGYHNHDFEFEPYGDTLVYDHILTSTDPKLVFMELDLYWIVKAGKDPVAYFNKYPGRFPLWHVKDMDAATGDITEVGNGKVDFKAIFAERKKAGLEQWFVEQDVSKGDMFESLKKSHDYIVSQKFPAR
ncbi:MAG: sugar phosphate isomerase/epimerase [Chitinophagaceae bacterium]|nr:MAG: sugar phosphate isomerase/epimerase [Chitinophagaceae bacterium]